MSLEAGFFEKNMMDFHGFFETQVDSQGFSQCETHGYVICTFPSWGVEFQISIARLSGRMLLEESGRSETHRILGILGEVHVEQNASRYVKSKDDGIFPSRSLYPWEGEDFLGPDGRPLIRLKPTLF